MLRFLTFLIWCVLGFCLLIFGCRGVISADGLEASLTMVTPGTPLPADLADNAPEKQESDK